MSRKAKPKVELPHNRNGQSYKTLGLMERRIVFRLLLPQIADDLQQAKLHAETIRLEIVELSFSYAKRMAEVEARIEILEVILCGSTGGFDKGQPHSRSVHDRFAWLQKRAEEKYQFRAEPSYS